MMPAEREEFIPYTVRSGAPFAWVERLQYSRESRGYLIDRAFVVATDSQARTGV